MSEPSCWTKNFCESINLPKAENSDYKTRNLKFYVILI